MQLDQIAILALLAVMLVAFASDRFAIELVALCGLGAALILGLVSPADAFSGFSSTAVVTVVEILLLVTVVARAPLFSRLAGGLTRRVRSPGAALAVLLASAALLSSVMNNIGALALMLPVVLSVCARMGIAREQVLMPLSFATLLGGLCTSIGTPANLVVSEAAQHALGRPLAMLDFSWVGVPVTVVGLAWLVATRPRAAAHPPPVEGEAEATDDRRFVTELVLGDGSPLAGLARPEAEQQAGIRIHNVLRDGRYLFGRPAETRLAEGDLLVAELGAGALSRMSGSGRMRLARARGAQRHEIVVLPQSTVVGSGAGLIEAFRVHRVEVLAVGVQRHRVEGRLDDLALGIGDVLVVEGEADAVRSAVAATDTMAITSPDLPGGQSGGNLGLVVFGLAVLTAALGILPPEIALGGGVLALAVAGELTLRRALRDVTWPIVVMLAAMIPLGAAVESTGAAATLAEWLVEAATGAPPVVLVGVVLLLAAALTPFVNNVSTAVVLAPLAVETARSAGLPVEPFLFAVALGASLDFLTPFGHHNNTIVMGIGGYRFADFPAVGAPLLLVTAAVGLAAIAVAWLP